MTDYATLLRDHTTLTCRSVDRIFLQGYVPGLQTPGLVARFLLHRGFPLPSSAALGQIGDRYVEDIRRWAKAEGVPVHYFKKGEKKEAVAEPLLEAAAKEGGEGAGGPAWDCAGEGLGLALLEGQGAEVRRTAADGMGPADDVCQSLLLVPLGYPANGYIGSTCGPG